MIYDSSSTHSAFASDGLTESERWTKMQERFEAQSAGKAGAPHMNNSVGNYTPSPNFRSNHVRGKIFEDSSRKLHPDRKYLQQYEDFLVKYYIKALQAQLDISGRKSVGGVRTRFAKVGYASGALQKSIRAEAKTIIRRSTKAGKILIKYELRPDYLDYGDYIANGRSAGSIPDGILVKWLERKIAMGALRVYKKRKGSGDTGRAPKILRIAKAISWAASKQPKPPVLKDWSSWTGNPNLRNVFKSLIRGKDAYYKSQIRKSIIRNLKTDYGS